MVVVQDKPEEETTGTTGDDDAMKTDEKPVGDGETVKEGAAPKSKRRKDEPSSEQLPNLSRVTPLQLPHISFAADARHVPVREVKAGGAGVLVMRDRRPNDEAAVEFLTLEANKALEEAARTAQAGGLPAAAGGAGPAGGANGDFDPNEPIAPVPEPFEFDFGNSS